MTAVIGRRPIVQDGAWVWHDTSQLSAALHVRPGAIGACTGVSERRAKPFSVPRCVMADTSTAFQASGVYPQNVVHAGPLGALDVLGSTTGGNNFTGWNVVGGPPVYANINGHWVTGWNPHAVARGTELATPATYRSLIGGFTLGEQLNP